MKLSYNLIDVVQVFQRQVSQSWKFSSFNIGFENDVLFSEVMGSENVLEGVEGIFACLLCFFVSANIVEHIIVSICWALRLCIVRTVILIVWHFELGGDITAQSVSSFNANVYHSLGVGQKVATKDIASLISITIAGILTVGVLNCYKATL